MNRTRSRRGGPFLRRSAAALAFLVTTLATACTHDTNDQGLVDSHYTVLQRFVTDGVHWQLDAFSDANGSFCMGIDGPRGPDHSAHLSWSNAACTFDHSDAGGYFGGGQAPGPGAFVAYGPLPDDAVGVRVSTKQVVPSRPLPTGHGLPRGRYWISYEPAAWPGKGAKSVDPQPLDASGRNVPFKKF